MIDLVELENDIRAEITDTETDYAVVETDESARRKKAPLTKAQKARRAKNKVAKQSRKKNRPR